MKKIILFAIILIATISTEAKIWRVNNNPNLGADVLQGGTLFDNNAGNGEALTGDTIYIEPSATDYNGFTINEANITVLGYGYLLDINTGLQAANTNSRVYSISLAATATGAKISGLQVDYIYLYASDCTITRNMVYSLSFYQNTNANNIKINKCFFGYGISDGTPAGSYSVNAAIENNIFANNTPANNTGTYGIILSSRIKGLFRNNITNGVNFVRFYNFYAVNNIFIGNSDFGNATSSGNNIFRNNLFSHNNTSSFASVYNNTAPNQGNLFAVNMATVFEGTTDNTWNGTTVFNNWVNQNATTNVESKFELKAGSPAIAAGESGSTVGGTTVTTPNCGAFGATDPYKKAGLPNIPSIYNLVVPATATAGGTMNVSVSSRSNN